MNLDPSQKSAVSAATSRPFSIITGGAGTGKTCITAECANTMERNGETVVLLAPTGKAAARQREACKRPAATIHRHLGYNGSIFQRETLAGESIIVDEASMIDSFLMAELVERTPKRLILVGDQSQLAPVGRGQPFHDIAALRPALVSNLTTCYRATEAVFQAATAIRNGGRPSHQATSDGEYWCMTNTGDAKRTQSAILALVTGPAAGWDWSRDIILVARNGESDEDPATVRGLNRAIVDIVSPRDWANPKTRFCVGDRVINTQNLPRLDMWNGSTGTVHAVDIDGGIWIHTDIPAIDWSKTKDERNPIYTDHVLFGKDVRRHLQLAYALTVHKSQGSQYRNVIFAGFQRDLFGLLDRSLLYTAVTRTKEACMVMGELSAINAAIDKVAKKRTVMQELAKQ